MLGAHLSTSSEMVGLNNSRAARRSSVAHGTRALVGSARQRPGDEHLEVRDQDAKVARRSLMTVSPSSPATSPAPVMTTPVAPRCACSPATSAATLIVTPGPGQSSTVRLNGAPSVVTSSHGVAELAGGPVTLTRTVVSQPQVASAR